MKFRENEGEEVGRSCYAEVRMLVLGRVLRALLTLLVRLEAPEEEATFDFPSRRLFCPSTTLDLSRTAYRDQRLQSTHAGTLEQPKLPPPLPLPSHFLLIKQRFSSCASPGPLCRD
jgi:hypothetical protein